MRRGLTRVAANEPTAGNLVRLFEAELDEAMKFQFFDSMLDPNVAPRMAELVCSGSQAMFDERNRTWFPILQRYVDAGIVRSNLDFAAAVRWITYQEFWLLTHPTVLTGGHEIGRPTFGSSSFTLPGMGMRPRSVRRSRAALGGCEGYRKRHLRSESVVDSWRGLDHRTDDNIC